MDIRLRIEGSILGHLIGNALGARCKNKKISRPVINQQIARNYTEAGAMTLCTMSSLLDAERIDLEDIMGVFQDWYLASYLASGTQIDSRITISQSIRIYGNGMPPDRCGSTEEPSDNSALIRMLPIALWNANQSLETIVRDAHEVTKITNQQIEAQVCSVLYCLAVSHFVINKYQASDDLAIFYRRHEYTDHSEALKRIVDHADCEINGGRNILDSFWSAMKTVAKHRDQFDEAITQSILLGNDCEETACLVGSIMGLSLGINGIPQHWLNQMDLTDEARNVAKKFASIIIKRNSTQN